MRCPSRPGPEPGRVAGRRRARTTLMVGGAALVVSLVAGTALPAKLFLWPASHRPTAADAVVVLSGDFGDRLTKALQLMRAGVAPTLVIDGEPDYARMAQLCTGDEPFEVVCLRPEPDSTRT